MNAMIFDEITLLAQRVGEKLQEKGWRLCLAESCTGGGVAEAITRIKGSSQWFEYGFVTYSNQAKQDLLHVEPFLLENYGAVSAQTVEAMVQGALTNSNAQVALAISGIAGPDGGTADKPVGTVWFAWVTPERTEPYSQCCHFKGNRQSIRQQAVMYGLQRLL
ncbi:MAG: CinA family protein [Gammaproteobacteria bacterium]